MKKNIINLAVISGLTVILSACSSIDYYQVESKFTMSTKEEQPAQVTRSRNFSQLYGQINTLAVRAPDQCLNESQSEKTGHSKKETKVMQTNCGVEMSLIERALAKRGYSVISWKILQNEMRVSKTHLDAAKALGADALFQINSLERSTSSAGGDARWDRRYFETDRDVSDRETAEVNAVTAEQLKNLSQQTEVKMMDLGRLSVTVNANVIFANDGRAIWFYEWNHIEDKIDADDVVAITNVRCMDNRCRRFYPAMQNGGMSEETFQGSSEAISEVQKPEDKRKATHDKLMRELIDDMVNKFSM